jgi:hypothetical protein
MPDADAIAKFRAASSTCQEELLAVLQRYAAALGPVGQFDSVIEFAGSVGDALLEAAPIAPTQAHVARRVTELALYLARTSAPQ